MTFIDDIFYYSCCFIVVLHSLSALLVITHGRCTVYAAAFLIASAMWLSLSVLNLWFFLPTVIQDAAELVRTYEPPLHDGSSSNMSNCLWQAVALLRTVALSSAASYLYMMVFGWFVGAMSLSNALTMWQREGCDAMEPHCHTHPAAAWLVRTAYRVEGWVAIDDSAVESQPLPRWEKVDSENDTEEKKTAITTTTTMMVSEDDVEEETCRVRQGGSFLFAVPRRLHSCYMLLLAPQVQLLCSMRTAGDVETSEKGTVN